jgi:hypothetical protein
MGEPDRIAIIIASPDDIHAQTVAWEVGRLGGRAVILDTAEFPAGWRLSMSAGGPNSPQFSVTTSDGLEIEDSRLRGLWLRRRNAPVVPAEITNADHRSFCEDESRALLDGWLYALGRRAINPLQAERTYRPKPYQLDMAVTSGLKIPKTLVTNDAAAAAAFAEGCESGGIYKILTNTPWQFTETRPLGPEQVRDLGLLKFAPVIFQERIEGGPDVRITIVDDQIFSAEMRPHHPEADLDWRMDLAVETLPHDLPGPVASKLIDYHRRSGLRYGAYDLRRDACGEYVFFEVNPGGQFLFVEIHTGLPISRAIARGLLGL